MSSIPTMSKVVIACKTAPTLNSHLVRTLFSSNVYLKSDYSGKKGNGVHMSESVPRNIEEINSSMKVKFSPHRTRDASSARIDVKMSQPSGTFGQEFMGSQGAKASHRINTRSQPSDSHVEVYDAGNSVSLSSVMQSNVPKPFETRGTEAPAHLGMPGGQWSQGDKYVSGDLHDHHDRNISKKYPGMGQPTSMYTKYPKKHTGMGYSSILLSCARPPLASFLAFDTHQTFATNTSWCGFCSSSIMTTQNTRHVWQLQNLNSVRRPLVPFINAYMSAWCEVLSGRQREFSQRHFSTGEASLVRISSVIWSQGQGDEGLSQRQKLKRAVKEYGATVIVFHVTIALASLGFFYLLVSSGIDMSGLIDRLGINLATLEQNSSSAVAEPSLGGEERPGEELPKTEDGGRKRVQSVAAGVSTFVLAYAIHKVFAPVRIGITLTATPFIVRHLRKIGVLKPPKSV